MAVFELVLALLLGGVGLSLLAPRLGVPWPALEPELALALPMEFPGRDLILFASFCVVLGTLVLPSDESVEEEVALARAEAARAALDVLGTAATAGWDREARHLLERECRARLDVCAQPGGGPAGLGGGRRGRNRPLKPATPKRLRVRGFRPARTFRGIAVVNAQETGACANFPRRLPQLLKIFLWSVQDDHADGCVGPAPCMLFPLRPSSFSPPSRGRPLGSTWR